MKYEKTLNPAGPLSRLKYARNRSLPSAPIKRPAKRRQQSATQADEAVDVAIAMVQIKKTIRVFNSASNLLRI